MKPTAVEATEDTNDAAATAAPVETVEPDAANSVAYIDNAPIKAVKIDTKIKKENTKNRLVGRTNGSYRVW